MKVSQIFVSEGFKNTYSEGDQVETSFGVGTIAKELGQTAPQSDYYFAVLFDNETVQKFNLENNPVKLPSSDFGKRYGNNTMSEGRDMTLPDASNPYGYSYNSIDDAKNNNAYQGSNGRQQSYHYDNDLDRNEQHGAPLEELTPEELQQKIEEEQENKRKVEIALANLQKAYRNKTINIQSK